MQKLKLEQLGAVWARVLKDTDARRALNTLERDGFAIAHLTPQDATLKRPNWSDYIAATPFLPNTPAKRKIVDQNTLRKHRPVVRALRLLALKVQDPFCEVVIRSTRNSSVDEITQLSERLLEAADFLERFLSWDWYTRERNPRNSVIAQLRWEFRWRTGKPHDAELNTILDAAFRGAGIEGGFYIDATALDRIEKREKEGRVKAHDALARRSTRIRQNSRQRV